MNGSSVFQRIRRRSQNMFQKRLRAYGTVLPMVAGKAGLEIGGPSALFQSGRNLLPIYDKVGSLDNCDLSRETIWTTHNDRYVFNKKAKPGKNIFCDASDLRPVADQSYDFILSCHNLEHLANPVKALKEWKRVTRPNGGLILVLPDYRRTFDHRRTPTPVGHMLEDYARDTGEDDLTHLPEILVLHDLDLDRPAGTPQEFRERSLNNFSNRCLHHHVFDENNSRELLYKAGMDVMAVELAYPFHIVLLSRFLPDSSGDV